MGSKQRFVKEILPIILKERKEGQTYVEPFAGGMNVICNVTGKRVACDNNLYLIEMWKGLVNGGSYDESIPKELYNEARELFNKGETSYKYPLDIIGWIGWMGSANGRFFDGGYSGISRTKLGTERDYIKEAISNIKKQVPLMVGVQLVCCDYSDILLTEQSLIYCDPPYRGTKQYGTSKDFCHEKFFAWCREMVKNGHTIFVSEYDAPEDFICVWEKEAKSSLSANGIIGGNKNSVEKLFKVPD